MFPSQCSQKNLSGHRPRCCRASVVTRLSGALGSSNNMQTGSAAFVQKRRRNESNNRIIIEDIQAFKQTRHEIRSHESPGRVNRDSTRDAGVVSNNIASYNNRSTDNQEIMLSSNHGMRVLGNLGNIPSTINQNAALNNSILQSPQNHNTPRNISDSRISIGERLHSMNDVFAVPGPSGLPNVHGEKLQSRSAAEIQSVMLRNEKTLTCRVCRAEIAEHAVAHEDKIFYYCCVCGYKTLKKANLQMHSCLHCPKNSCNICATEYTEGDSHESEHRCNECTKIFPCKSVLDLHYLDHEEFFAEYCRICFRSLDDHITEQQGKKPYACCVCRQKMHSKSNLRMHNYIHRPMTCLTCREEYSLGDIGVHESEYTCIVCDKKFQCQALLEEHSEDHEYCFFTHCRVCKKEIEEHVIEYEETIFYKCCRCLHKYNRKSALRDHLYTHTGVRLFKCGLCGKRFVQKADLETHLRTCKYLFYKCKRCGLRFLSRDSLDKHHKHLCR